MSVDAGDRIVTSTLTIRVAMVNDSGEYVCTAMSPPYDPVSSDPAQVFVQSMYYMCMYSNRSKGMVLPTKVTGTLFMNIYPIVEARIYKDEEINVLSVVYN